MRKKKDQELVFRPGMTASAFFLFVFITSDKKRTGMVLSVRLILFFFFLFFAVTTGKKIRQGCQLRQGQKTM